MRLLCSFIAHAVSQLKHTLQTCLANHSVECVLEKGEVGRYTFKSFVHHQRIAQSWDFRSRSNVTVSDGRSVFTAHALQCKARYCDRMSSVCLSVCLSVTFVNCDHICWNSSKIISPLVSLRCSLFATPTWRVCSKGNTPKFWPKVTHHPLLIWASETFDRKLRPNGYR